LLAAAAAAWARRRHGVRPDCRRSPASATIQRENRVYFKDMYRQLCIDCAPSLRNMRCLESNLRRHKHTRTAWQRSGPCGKLLSCCLCCCCECLLLTIWQVLAVPPAAKAANTSDRLGGIATAQAQAQAREQFLVDLSKQWSYKELVISDQGACMLRGGCLGRPRNTGLLLCWCWTHLGRPLL
jgi:hypothetical protein